MKITKAVLIKETNYFIQELRLLKPKQESLEWYLLNNLDIYLQAIECAYEAKDIKNSTRILSRFCTESMDWDTNLYKKCIELTNIGFKLARQENFDL